VISEGHRVPTVDAVDLVPTETIFSEAGSKRLVASYAARILCQKWAEYNGASHVEWPGSTRDVKTRDPEKLFAME
jgi:hypothetical protein